MPRLVKAACPNCGAGVELDPTRDWVTCNYCATSSFIQRPAPKHGTRQAPRPPVDYPVIQLPPEARAAFRFMAFLPFVLIMALLFAGAVVAFIVASGAGSASTLERVLPAAAKTKPTIVGAPMLGDVDGDGDDDVIVMTQTSSGETLRHLSGIDIDTGDYVWTTKKLATSGDSSALVAGVAANRVLVARLATLEAFDVRTGQSVWQATLPEKAELYCKLPGGAPAVATKDNRLFAIDLASGTLSDAGSIERHPMLRDPRFTRLTRAAKKKQKEKPPPCVPLSSDIHQVHGPGVMEVHAALSNVAGMSAHKALTLGHQPPYILTGSKQGGSRIPMVAAYTGEALSWKQEVPAANPMAAKEGDPLGVTIAPGRVVVAYEMQEPKQLRMTSFELTTGKRQWDVALPAPETSFARLVASEQHAMLRAGWSIHVVSLTDGRLARTLP